MTLPEEELSWERFLTEQRIVPDDDASALPDAALSAVALIPAEELASKSTMVLLPERVMSADELASDETLSAEMSEMTMVAELDASAETLAAFILLILTVDDEDESMSRPPPSKSSISTDADDELSMSRSDDIFRPPLTVTEADELTSISLSTGELT